MFLWLLKCCKCQFAPFFIFFWRRTPHLTSPNGPTTFRLPRYATDEDLIVSNEGSFFLKETAGAFKIMPGQLRDRVLTTAPYCPFLFSLQSSNVLDWKSLWKVLLFFAYNVHYYFNSRLIANFLKSQWKWKRQATPGSHQMVCEGIDRLFPKTKDLLTVKISS